MTVPVMNAVEKLQVPVLEHPRWRVNYRPSAYVPRKLATLSECLAVLQRTRVALRGWDFPYISPYESERAFGDSWIAGWSDYRGHLEYWRFYQSTQFLYLGSVREVTDADWTPKLRRTMKRHPHGNVDLDAVPGFLSLTNSIYNITEFFEFAARLSQAQVYADPVTITVSLTGIAGFMLATDEGRSWKSGFVSSADDLRYETTVAPADLVSSTADHAMACSIWLVERFGWLNPNVDAMRADQQKLLTRQF